MMTIGIPQAIYIFLILFGMGISAARFGQKKNDSYDWVDVFFAPAISLCLLYWGGFFG